MIKIIYILLIAASLIMLCGSAAKRKKIKQRKNIKDAIFGISRRLHFIMPKKDNKLYGELDYRLKKSGLKITPEVYVTIMLLFPGVVFIFYVCMKLVNHMNLMTNFEEIKIISELTQNVSLLDKTLDINVRQLILTYLITMLLQHLILSGIIGIKGAVGEKEAMILQTYTILMLRSERPVKEILINLYQRAKIFKPHLEYAISIYSRDPIIALRELKKMSTSSNFEKICIALEQMLNNNKDLSKLYLENHRRLAKELNKQMRLRKNTRNEIIGILLMIVPILIFIAIGGYPVLVNVMKEINNMPI